MMPGFQLDETQLKQIQSLHDGGEMALAEQFEQFSPQLRNLIFYRLPDTLKRRVDISDILQDAFVEASRRLKDYLASAPVPVCVWLRQITRNVISRNYRFHTAAAKRSTEKELPIHRTAYADVDSMVACLSDSMASPLSQIANVELQQEVRRLLDSMEDVDREVLCLKQLEKLSFTEVAAELEIDVSSAKRRFQRAVLKLRHIASHLNTASHVC